MLGALHKDHAVVALQHAGVCSTCSLGTYMACARCRTAHYCSSVCRREQSVDHAKECGQLHCKPVPLPAGDLLHSVVNMRLRTDGVFGVTPTDQQQPKVFVASAAYGLASLAVPHALASSMAAKVNGSRSPEDCLQIGGKSFPGYLDYIAIPVPVDREVEQCRRTAMLLAHKGHIRYCMEHWPLRDPGIWH